MYKKLILLSFLFFLGSLFWTLYDAISNPPPTPPLYTETRYLSALEPPLHDGNLESTNSPKNFEEVRSILQKNFHYKDHGASTVAFISEDGKYILKLFKMRDAKTDKEIAERLAGYQLAHDIHKKNTGIIYWHLYQTDHLNIESSIVDTIGVNRYTKLGIRRNIDLDNYIFVLQQKANKMGTLLNSALRKGKVELARSYLQKFFVLYDEELEKGILDIDAKFFFNTGFYEGIPIRFDVSHLRTFEEGPSEDFVYLFRREVLKHVIRWLQKRDYESHTEIMQDVVVWLTRFPNKMKTN